MGTDRHLPEKALALPLPYVEANPEDAKRLGLKSGDLVEVYNEEGNGTFLVYVTDAVKPGTLFPIGRATREQKKSSVCSKNLDRMIW